MKVEQLSPGLKFAVARSVFWREVNGRIELWDWTDRVASFPLSMLDEEDLEAIKNWTTEAEEVKNE